MSMGLWGLSMADLVRLDQLRRLDSHALRSEWSEAFGRPAPAGLRRELMVRILGYRLQERAFGGLSRDARRRLAQLAKTFAANPKALIPDVPTIKPGTRLIRSWQGQIHQVTVTDKATNTKGGATAAYLRLHG